MIYTIAWIPDRKDHEAGTLSSYGVEYCGGRFLKGVPSDMTAERAETITSVLNEETNSAQGIYIVASCLHIY